MVNFQRTEPSKVKFYNGTQMANFMSTIPFNVLEREQLSFIIFQNQFCVFISNMTQFRSCVILESKSAQNLYLGQLLKKYLALIYQTYTFEVSINLTNSSFLFHIHTHYWVIILNCVSIFHCICSDVCFYASQLLSSP